MKRMEIEKRLISPGRGHCLPSTSPACEMVRRVEGPVADQRDVAGQHAGDGVGARDVQRLGGGHAGKIEGRDAQAASCRSRVDRT